MTDGEPGPTADATVAIDPDVAVAGFIEALERSTYLVTEIASIPPIDHDVIEAARAEATSAAEAAGRGLALARAQRTMADWTLRAYQRAGFRAAYLQPWMDDPERRLEVVSMLVDATTGYAMQDLLPDETTATLLARFDVSYGGPIFRATPEESASAADAPPESSPSDGG
jgi:hypothetical protein